MFVKLFEAPLQGYWNICILSSRMCNKISFIEYCSPQHVLVMVRNSYDLLGSFSVNAEAVLGNYVQIYIPVIFYVINIFSKILLGALDLIYCTISILHIFIFIIHGEFKYSPIPIEWHWLILNWIMSWYLVHITIKLTSVPDLEIITNYLFIYRPRSGNLKKMIFFLVFFSPPKKNWFDRPPHSSTNKKFDGGSMTCIKLYT